jgi:hypothetical protein
MIIYATFDVNEVIFRLGWALAARGGAQAELILFDKEKPLWICKAKRISMSSLSAPDLAEQPLPKNYLRVKRRYVF